MTGYARQLESVRDALRTVQIALMRQEKSAIVLLEGFDAAGKGGVIRELSYAWDPRGFDVHPIGPPTTEESAHPFLWRFWCRLPRPGKIAVFDRSWYGRLLVETVEYGLSEQQYTESVAAIESFEGQIRDSGTQLIKLFLWIEPETQRQRLKRRADSPEKRWKLTASDLDSLKLRGPYDGAVKRMLALPTETPWHVIASDDKKTGRLQTLETVLAALDVDLKPRTFSYNPGVEARLGELE